MPNVQQGYVPQSVYNTALPCKGLKTIPILIDFSLGTTFTLDLSLIQSQAFMDWVQTIYVENSANTSGITITMEASKQVIKFPASSEGYLPILQPNPAKITLTCTNPVQVIIQLMNFYVGPYIWNSSGAFAFSGSALLVSDAALDAIIVSGALNVRNSPGGVTLTDRSGTITVGGTVQSLMVVNPARKLIIVSNPSTATEILQICFGVGTAGKINLIAGEMFREDNVSIITDAVFVVAATGAHAFTAYEGQ